MNEKELLENATPGSIGKASKCSMKIFQVKNNLSFRVSQSKTILETIYTFKNDLYSVTSGTSHKMKLRRLVKYLWGVFNKTIIPLALVGYEMIIANLRLIVYLSSHIERALEEQLDNDYKTKGTVRAEENKDPWSHHVVMKNGMTGV